MKIIIVGAGIGGLAAYHALRKHLADIDFSLEIKLVERHSSPTSTTQTIGGGLGLAPNGLRAISSLSLDAAAHIRECGAPGSLMSFRNARGRLLGTFKAGRGERYSGFEQLMLPRAIVHESLLPVVREEDVTWGMRVKDVKSLDSAKGVIVQYEDGTAEEADLVIGADGVRSMVREALFEGGFDAKYDGLTGVGGFLPLSSLPTRLQESLKTELVTMTFGQQGFFGYSMCSPLASPNIKPFIQWWSIYEVADPPKRNEINISEVRKQLLERHGNWRSPHDEDGKRVYSSIIKLGSEQSHEDGEINTRLMVLPRFFTPRLPRWTSADGRIVLLGDAAHAMPPDSGQGVSCAAEDAVVFALFLKHYYSESLSSSSELDAAGVIKKTGKAYESIRMPRVHAILDLAKRNGDAKRKMGWFAERLRDFAMGVICKLPESMNDKVFGYDCELVVGEYIKKCSK